MNQRSAKLRQGRRMGVPSMEDKKVYTALLIGVPGSTDTATSVQIRYIENGKLSEDTTAQGFSHVSPKSISIQ